MPELTDELGTPLTDESGTILIDVPFVPPFVPPVSPPFPSLIPGSLAWMNQSMRTVKPVLTLDQSGFLVNQYSDESGWTPYITEDGTADYTIENPVFDLVRWV